MLSLVVLKGAHYGTLCIIFGLSENFTIAPGGMTRDKKTNGVDLKCFKRNFTIFSQQKKSVILNIIHCHERCRQNSITHVTVSSAS